MYEEEKMGELLEIKPDPVLTVIAIELAVIFLVLVGIWLSL